MVSGEVGWGAVAIISWGATATGRIGLRVLRPLWAFCKGNHLMRHILPLLCLTALIASSGCQTIEGAGRDMSSAGHAVTQEAQKANN